MTTKSEYRPLVRDCYFSSFPSSDFRSNSTNTAKAHLFRLARKNKQEIKLLFQQIEKLVIMDGQRQNMDPRPTIKIFEDMLQKFLEAFTQLLRIKYPNC